jgi:glycolate oxidase FAD binding subunit
VTREALLAHATTLVGEGFARLPTSATDHVDGLAPSIVVEPPTVDTLARTLTWASSSGLAVVLRGGGSRDRWGRSPRAIDVLIRFTHLNRVVAHEASDLTTTVEAGATLADVNRHLALSGQRLPLDGAPSATATIGGLLATNDTGPLRHRHGTPRDLVIGMTVVMADGLVSASGGRVVKNVAGYDIGRLVTGAHGALAAIVSATFKLAPLAPASRTLRVGLRRASDVTAFTDLLRQAQCEPEAIDVSVARASGGSAAIAMLILFASVQAAVDDACVQAARCAEQIGAAVEAADGDTASAWWQAHQAGTDLAASTTLRLSWRPSEFDRAAEALLSLADGVPLMLTGRAAVGSGSLGLAGDTERHAGIIETLRTHPLFRHVVIADASATVRSRVDVWGPSPDQTVLWQALKQACDPRDTLGAGRGPL